MYRKHLPVCREGVLMFYCTCMIMLAGDKDTEGSVAMQGAGIVWPTTIGKLELNLCKVLKADRHDKLLTTGFGLQVGFSPAI